MLRSLLTLTILPLPGLTSAYVGANVAPHSRHISVQFSSTERSDLILPHKTSGRLFITFGDFFSFFLETSSHQQYSQSHLGIHLHH